MQYLTLRMKVNHLLTLRTLSRQKLLQTQICPEKLSSKRPSQIRGLKKV